MREKSERRGAAPPGDRPWRVALVALGLAALTWFTFVPALRHEFVNYDDNVYVLENPTVARGLTAAGVRAAFTQSHAGNWHPLTTLSHQFDCQLGGLDPRLHHRTNVLLHAAAVVILFLALQRLTGALWPSAMVAALFAVHPLRVESVAWVAERKDVLSGVFLGATLLAYAQFARKPNSWPRYVALMLAFALGLMTKPTLVTLPLVLLLLDYWPLRRCDSSSPDRRATLRKLVLEKCPLLALSAAVCIVTLLVQVAARQSTDLLPLSQRLSNAAVSYVKYVEQTFWPAKLAVFYPYPTIGLAKLAGALAILTLITAAAIYWRRERPFVPVGWLWFVGMLVPMIGLVQVGTQAHADRYTYLPQIGLFLALVWIGATLAAHSRQHRWVCGLIACAAVAGCVAATRAQLPHWQNSEMLWRRALAVTADNAVAESNLANELFRQRRTDEAREHYERALAIQPDFDDAHNGLGFILLQQGNTELAIGHFLQALEVRPESAAANNNLGMALLQTGRIADAIPAFELALQAKPDQAETHNNLGYALLRAGRPHDAVAHYRRSLELQPDNVATCNNLAWALATYPGDGIRNGREAVEWAERAARLTEGNHLVVLRTLAAAYAEAGRFAEAIQVASRTMEVAARQNQPAMIATLRREIALYQNNQPLREPVDSP